MKPLEQRSARLACVLADGTTPDTTVAIDRETGIVTVTTAAQFPPGEAAEQAADFIWTRVQDLQAIRAGLENQ